jgi:hypothetical protein
VARALLAVLRFLRDDVDGGGQGGTLTLRPCQELSIGAAYEYRAPNALFLGGPSYQSPALQFTAKHPRNLMLGWDARTLRLLSAADATVRLDPGAFVPSIRVGKAAVAGRVAQSRTEERREVISVVEGEDVRLRYMPAHKELDMR